MAFFRWIADKIFGPPKRDVSRLEQDDVEVLAESVDLSGGPLKPGHHRKALRDKRLLPKRKPSGFSPLKKKRLFTADTAGRLFSRTLRTRDRNIRDLLADPDQLRRYRLPVWDTEKQVAEALGLSVKELRHFSIYRNRDRVSHYLTFRIPKAKGGERLIMAPKAKLKAIQRKLLKKVLAQLPVSDHAHGFIKGRSVKTAAEPHVGKKVVVKFDLENFFGTVTFPRIRGLFIALGYSYPVATILAVLTTDSERQPVVHEDHTYHVPVGPRHCVQGAPTSPALCNQIAGRMDRRLHLAAQRLGFAYTRYADDLTFSGDDVEMVAKLMGLCQKIVSEEGFRLRRDKTKVLGRGGCQRVVGVTVNDTLGLSRKERRKLRAMLHRLQNEEEPDASELRKAEGKLAYLEMLNPEQAEALRGKYSRFRRG